MYVLITETSPTDKLDIEQDVPVLMHVEVPPVIGVITTTHDVAQLTAAIGHGAVQVRVPVARVVNESSVLSAVGLLAIHGSEGK